VPGRPPKRSGPGRPTTTARGRTRPITVPRLISTAVAAVLAGLYLLAPLTGWDTAAQIAHSDFGVRAPDHAGGSALVRRAAWSSATHCGRPGWVV